MRFSQLDAAYPLSGRDGPLYGVPYVLKSIPWASHAGCQRIATTDGLHKPEGLSDDEAMELMKRSYAQILEVAKAYEIAINIEVHGYFTTNPDMMERLLRFCDSPYLRLNLDTGNTFIAGRDPVAFCRRFKDCRRPTCTSKTSAVAGGGGPRRADGHRRQPVRHRRRRQRGEHPRRACKSSATAASTAC